MPPHGKQRVVQFISEQRRDSLSCCILNQAILLAGQIGSFGRKIRGQLLAQGQVCNAEIAQHFQDRVLHLFVLHDLVIRRQLPDHAAVEPDQVVVQKFRLQIAQGVIVENVVELQHGVRGHESGDFFVRVIFIYIEQLLRIRGRHHKSVFGDQIPLGLGQVGELVQVLNIGQVGVQRVLRGVGGNGQGRVCIGRDRKPGLEIQVHKTRIAAVRRIAAIRAATMCAAVRRTAAPRITRRRAACCAAASGFVSRRIGRPAVRFRILVLCFVRAGHPGFLRNVLSAGRPSVIAAAGRRQGGSKNRKCQCGCQ